MKRILVIILTLAAVIAAYAIGNLTGKNHAIYDAEMFVVDLPDRNASGGFDTDEITVYVQIDNDIHEYGAFIG